MKILNVVSILSSRFGGGNAERTIQLSQELVNAGNECTVLTLEIGDPTLLINKLGGARLEILACLNKRFQVPYFNSSKLKNVIRNSDVIHIMGYWSILAVIVARIARQEGVPYVICPAGALPLFGRSIFLKRIFNFIFGYNLIRNANGWIAVTASELPDFEQYSIKSHDVEVIPNGVVESDFTIPITYSSLIPESPYILFMGRLNYIKGPDLLLDAFIKISANFPLYELVLAGPDEGLLNSLLQKAKFAGLERRVHFVGFVSGSDKVDLYRSAKLLVVPSRIEAMSIVAIEAGICGIPVVMTDQCGLDDLREVSQELVVPVSIHSLSTALEIAIGDHQRLKDWGLEWQKIVRSRFLWKDIGFRFNQFLLGFVER
jgi:glycosyltransferase involved in cell wall biosynthesis